ncbi:MAG: hypothetical protein M1429_02465 [Patescibacteria group bacterium]|nr:hypothetical protein [Patescibacteria group bacterium]
MHNRCVRGMSCKLVKNKNGITSLKAEGKAVGPNILPSVKPPLAVQRVWTDLWENELTREQRQRVLTHRGQLILVESKAVPQRRHLEGRYEAQPLSGKLSRSQEWFRGAVEFIEFVNNSRGTFVYHGFRKEGESPTRCLYYYRCRSDRFGIYIGVNDKNDHQLIQVEEGIISKNGNTIQLLSKDVDAIRIGCFPLNRMLRKIVSQSVLPLEERENIGIPRRSGKIVH